MSSSIHSTADETTSHLTTMTYADGIELRVLSASDNAPLICLADLAKGLGIKQASALARRLPDGVIQNHPITDRLGRTQTAAFVTEPGMNMVIWRSDKPAAIAYAQWCAERISEFRRHGFTATPDTVEAMLQDPDTMIATLTALKNEREARQATEQRAVKAETVVAAITDGGGITLTQFHKHHFPDVPARVFFQHLYDHQLLIDQRGKGRWDDKRNRFREGPQHRHPTYKGKAYMYLDGCLDGKDKRREYTKVRPGQPEVDLVELLARQGLPAALPSMSTVPALPAA